MKSGGVSLYGSDEADVFIIPDDVDHAVTVFDFNAEDDFIDLSNILEATPTDIDDLVNNFVTTTTDPNNGNVLLYVDKDGAGNSSQIELLAIIETGPNTDTDIDPSSIIV